MLPTWCMSYTKQLAVAGQEEGSPSQEERKRRSQWIIKLAGKCANCLVCVNV